MYERFAERQIKEALSDTPVVLLVGPRRDGTFASDVCSDM